MTKRICIITSTFQPGITEFASLLSKNGYFVDIIAPQEGEPEYVEEKVKTHFFDCGGQSNIPLSSLNPKKISHLFKLIRVIFAGSWFTLRFVRKNKTDFCLAWWAIPSGFFALLIRRFYKIPYVVLSVGSDIWKVQDYPFGKTILKKVLKNAKKLFADGIQLAKDVEEISGIECSFMATNRRLDKKIKNIEYKKIDPNKINFIFVGRYHVNKGVDILIDAIKLLSSNEMNKSLFHIFGRSGPEQEKIETMVSESNLSNVFINSAIPWDEVYSYIKKSDVVVIPSRIESIPVVLSNAIESEKPALVTNVGDMGDLVRKYNIGLVCDPNPESMKTEISKLINLEKNFEKFNFQNKELKDYLSLEKSVTKFIQIIKDKN